MPRFSYVHKGGTKIISCGKCNLYLTNKSELISNKFQGATGRAYLYNRVWNVCCSEKQHRDMMTGKHIVRDVMCLRCNEKLGWMYEFAMEEQQRYKEMRVILEKALIDESEGFPDPELGYADTCLPRSINDPPDAPPTMPRIFTQHWGGRRPFSCEKCGTFITNRDEVVSSNFRGFRGAALLVYRAANIKKGERTKRIMKSGKYIVRDVQCIICETALGWFYEFSSNEAQRYKEGKLVLERTLLRESEVTCPKLAERKATPTSFQGESNDSEVPAKSV